mmetsp:Transcript_11548/g.38172  ORF Transcript_11548/g.38172 Transcript_11548/m.38172 type:complete len:224 (+) Transcript_11548:592-1263(+)
MSLRLAGRPLNLPPAAVGVAVLMAVLAPLLLLRCRAAARRVNHDALLAALLATRRRGLHGQLLEPRAVQVDRDRGVRLLRLRLAPQLSEPEAHSVERQRGRVADAVREERRVCELAHAALDHAGGSEQVPWRAEVRPPPRGAVRVLLPHPHRLAHHKGAPLSRLHLAVDLRLELARAEMALLPEQKCGGCAEFLIVAPVRVRLGGEGFDGAPRLVGGEETILG